MENKGFLTVQLRQLEAQDNVNRPNRAILLANAVKQACEREDGAMFLWMPAAAAAGIGTYYQLPLEPGLFAVGLIVLSGALLVWRIMRSGGAATSRLFAVGLTAFLAAKANTELTANVALNSVVGPVSVEGTVVSMLSGRARTKSALVQVERVGGLPAAEKPQYIRLSLPSRVGLNIGSHIVATARLAPLAAPIAPGAHDFARSQWLSGIGATGRIIGDNVVQVTPPDRDPRMLATIELDHLRNEIGARIRAVLPGSTGDLAVALITGERSNIPRPITDSLQISGLSHVISISGLHMSLVAGGIFWALRGFLALFPQLTLHFPIKKWAALAALASGAFYLILSGNDVATQRSYLMLAIMFGAILVDRPALSLRNVAIAALVILLAEPPALLNAGFQMSFLAVSGLISLVAARRGPPPPHKPFGRQKIMPLQYLGSAFHSLVAMAATTLIAGLCTSSIAAYHFNRVSPYSLFANLMALPIVSTVIMPMALLATVMMPFGMESLPLRMMGLGLQGMMKVSDWTANLPGAKLMVPSHSLASEIVITFGVLWICIFRTNLRWLGFAFAGCGLLLASFSDQRPDILIERTIGNVAIRNSEGKLAILNKTRSSFATERWLAADGDSASLSEAAQRTGWECSGDTCRALVKGKTIIFAARSAEANFSCPPADIVIAAFPLRGRCENQALHIDRFDVWRNGAYALYISGNQIDVDTAQQHRGKRPWVPQLKPRSPGVNGSKDAVTHQ